MIPHSGVSMVAFSLGFLLVSCGGGGGPSAPASQTLAYYIDSTNGNDSNSGHDAAHPWQSLSKVSSLPVPSGSTVYLMSGSTWYEQLSIPSSAITISAYGSGNRPKIDGSRAVASWTSEGGGIFSSVVSLAAGEALGNVSENGVVMSFVAWNTDVVTTLSGALTGTFSYEYATSKIYIKPANSPQTSSAAYRASVKLYGITATALSDIVVRNIEIDRFSLNGVNYVNCQRCSVYNTSIMMGGGATIAPDLYAGNGIEFDNNSTDGVVDGVDITQIFDSCISPQTYQSGQSLSNITITNSHLFYCGFAGVEVSVLSNGGSFGSNIGNVTISGSSITNSGKGWSGQRYGTEGHGIRIKADAGAGTMSNVRVDTTSIFGSAGEGVKLAGEIGTVQLSRMDISKNHYGIDVSEANAIGLKLKVTSSLIYSNSNYGIHYDSPTASGFELYQNTLSDNSGINLAIFNQAGVAKVENNIFYGSSPMTHFYSAAALSGAVVDNNCYNELTNMFGYNAVAYSTVGTFNAASTFEVNGLGGMVGLTNPATGNFTLTNSSQCKTLGSSSVGVATDFSGYQFATPPSSGAFQFR